MIAVKKLKKLYSFYLLYKTYKMLKMKNKRRKQKRVCWVKSNNLTRNEEGYFSVTFLKIKLEDPKEFFKHTRMSRSIYDLFVNLLREYLTKHSIRTPIDYECRIALTLTYLSQGVSHQYLAWSFKMGKTTVRKIILETCEFIWKILGPFYLSSVNYYDYKQISEGFYKLWDMPHCIGALDGKHINLICPPKSGSLYFNYKKTFSIVLLAACDHNYCFTHIDVGSFGSQSDGGVLKNSGFGCKLLKGELNVPAEDELPKSDKKFPYFFVGDAAFPLKRNIMRPYPGKQLSVERTIFNYRLSRARRVIENAFGILVARWRILQTTLNCNPENAEKIVLACVVLHNFIKLHQKSSQSTATQYCPDGFVDWENSDHSVHEGAWRQEIRTEDPRHKFSIGSNNASRNNIELRDELAHYFVNEGAVSFQWGRS